MAIATEHAWRLAGATRDGQTITPTWAPAGLTLIAGVTVREVANVPGRQGHLTEIFRTDWFPGGAAVDQIFQVVLRAGAISAWHAHERTTDRIFITDGLVRIGLYDAREGSRTYGLVNDFTFGTVRPALVVVPPRVWHGVQNLAQTSSTVLNVVDRAYDYVAPDHWRAPKDSPEIPFAW
jgi:dTDP-4-dehydrorhamnose 3,5-epimerase